MYKVSHTINSFNKIDNFTRWYKNKFIDLFYDTGLFDEN
jgi:hypothetical protein